jgi:hypothetical protein
MMTLGPAWLIGRKAQQKTALGRSDGAGQELPTTPSKHAPVRGQSRHDLGIELLGVSRRDDYPAFGVFVEPAQGRDGYNSCGFAGCVRCNNSQLDAATMRTFLDGKKNLALPIINRTA